jgi:hypothetical protein
MKKATRSKKVPRKSAAKGAKKAARVSVRRRRSDELRAEYDFSGGERGKYAARFAEGTNLVRLEPDVAAEFRDGREVNRALRAWLKWRSARRTA